jgi:hypothetical protein
LSGAITASIDLIDIIVHFKFYKKLYIYSVDSNGYLAKQ